MDGSGRAFTAYANYRGIDGNSSAFGIRTGWFKFAARPRTNHSLTLGYTRQQVGETLYLYQQMDTPYDNADRASAAYTIDRPGGRIKRVQANAYFTRVPHWMTDEHRTSATGAALPFSMATFTATKTMGGRADAVSRDFTAGVEAYRRFCNAVNTMPWGRHT